MAVTSPTLTTGLQLSMRSNQRHALWLVLVTAITLSTACGNANNAAQSDANRFELKTDAQGRVVRLDRATGAVTVMNGRAPSREGQTNASEKTVATGRSDRPEPATPPASPEPASSCAQAGSLSGRTVTVSTDKAPLFIEPRVLPVALTNLSAGSVVPVLQVEGDWYRIRVNDGRWGPRVGYLHCTNTRLVTARASTKTQRRHRTSARASRAFSPNEPIDVTIDPRQESVDVSIHRIDEPVNVSIESMDEPVDVSINSVDHTRRGSMSRPATLKSETIAGYVEWLRSDQLVADGQRVHWSDQTRLRIGRLPSVASIPLGYEITVTGVRMADGTLLAQQLDVKPNRIAAFENEVKQWSDAVEAAWVNGGIAYLQDTKGNRLDIGRVVTSGPEVERSRRVLKRLLPPYVSPDHVQSPGRSNKRVECVSHAERQHLGIQRPA